MNLPDHPIPILSIIGKSGCGKTTLLEKLIAELKRRGYRVATIKHHSHPGFEIDQPGKDTWRHAQAGSDHVIIAAPDKIASIRRLSRPLTLDEIAAEIREVDIILTEGFTRREACPGGGASRQRSGAGRRAAAVARYRHRCAAAARCAPIQPGRRVRYRRLDRAHFSQLSVVEK